VDRRSGEEGPPPPSTSQASRKHQHPQENESTATYKDKGLGVEIQKVEAGFLFRSGSYVAGPYADPYSIDPIELAEKLNIDHETATKARFEAIKAYQGELGFEEIKDILGLTVKRDDVNKVVTFLCMVSAYSERDQFNVSFRAESSTGKSYIPLELAALFPREDVVEIAYSSPTAFYHEKGEYDKEQGVIIINLERKILIFLDQPHDQLLQRLRPLLSHDRKELVYKITDKREKGGLRTKTAIIIGFPAVLFCTGSLKMDDQEATRMILLSPETSQEKIREGIYLRAIRDGNRQAFEEWLNADPRRKMLKERIKEIKQVKISDVIIPDPHGVADRFIKGIKGSLKPRHMRDISRIISLIKSFAILNFMHREVLGETSEGKIIKAAQRDIEEAFKIWRLISEPQELGVSPFVYQVFKEIIEPLALESSREIKGCTRTEIMQRFLQLYGRPLSRIRLDRDILPSLEAAGLIDYASDPLDRRRTLIVPTTITHTPPCCDTFQDLNRGDGERGKNVSRRGGVELSPQSDADFHNSEEGDRG